MEETPFRPQRLVRLTRPRGWLTALALCGIAALPIGCGYQLDPTGTPAATPAPGDNTLHVHQLAPGSPTQTAAVPASLIDQMVQRYLDSAGQGSGIPADAAQPAAPSTASGPAAPAAAAATPVASPAQGATDSVARYAGPASPPLLTSDSVLPPVNAVNVAPAGSASPTPTPTPPPAGNTAMTAARTLTVGVPTAQVTAVSLAVTFPTGPASTQRRPCRPARGCGW